jgi:hypothetical protein
LTQSFQLQMLIDRARGTYAADSKHDLPLNVQWLGYERDRSEGAAKWSVIYDGPVKRKATCGAGKTTCQPVILFRTSAVHFHKFYVRVSLQNETQLPIDTLASWFSTATFEFTYRNPAFSRFELGFKYLWLLVSIGLLVSYVGLTNCKADLHKCRMYCTCLCLCCSRGRRRGYSDQSIEGTRWLYAILVLLVLFNEPLIGAQYRGDGTKVEAIKLLSVLMQLSFIVMLLSYWLVAFGLIKANAQVHEALFFKRFYLPKLAAMFVYWILAAGVTGFVLYRQASDPMYDWGQFNSAPVFLIVLAALFSIAYLSYLVFVVVRSFAVVQTFAFGEKYLFGIHLFVLLATAFSIAGGSIYGVSVQDSFSFLFITFLYNTYACLLVYLYAPARADALPTLAPGAEAAPADSAAMFVGASSEDTAAGLPPAGIAKQLSDEDDEAHDGYNADGSVATSSVVMLDWQDDSAAVQDAYSHLPRHTAVVSNDIQHVNHVDDESNFLSENVAEDAPSENAERHSEWSTDERDGHSGGVVQASEDGGDFGFGCGTEDPFAVSTTPSQARSAGFLATGPRPIPLKNAGHVAAGAPAPATLSASVAGSVQWGASSPFDDDTTDGPVQGDNALLNAHTVSAAGSQANDVTMDDPFSAALL